MNIREMTKEQLSEESMINIAYAILTETREPLTLQQLMDEIRKLTGMTEKKMKEKLQQFYTDMNIDGRFLAINDNRWGLREWYPVDQIEEETAPVVKVRKKKKKKAALDDDDEDEEDDEDDEDELFDEEFDELIDDEDEDDEDEEDEIVEIEVDLLEPDDDLEIIPDDEDIELDEEDEEEEDEEDEEEIEE
nr:DNA-directed RNA polymerase subunit delta [Sporosarcina sp. YIM B06819]